MVDWSDDKIAALSKQDLKNLLANAERKSAAEIVARCKAEMDKRDTSKPRKASKPRTELKEFEHAMSEQLAEIGKAMAEIRSVGGDRESKIGGREGLQGAQTAGLNWLCKTGWDATRRLGCGRPLYFIPAWQGYRLDRGLPAERPACRSP